MKDRIAENLSDVRGRIAEACREAGRTVDEICLVAITKTHPAAVVRTIVAAGIHDIGENRIQEAQAKIAELGPIARYHLVGHLQSNKVKRAVELFDVIQSVDSLRLAEEINRRAAEGGRTIDCLIEVNSSGEPQKYGIAPPDAIRLVEQVLLLPSLRLRGLMTIGPFTDDQQRVRAAFRQTRELFDQARRVAIGEFDTLSMGMSLDFPLAIAEGATMIRVGTALFGARSPAADRD